MLLSCQVNKAFGLTIGMYEMKKLTGIIFFLADNYAVVKEIVIKYGTKKIESRAIEMKSVNHMAELSFKIGTTI